VALVAAKHHHVALLQQKLLTAHAELDLTPLHRQVLPRARRVRHAAHAGLRRKCHALDLQSRQGLGQEPPHLDCATLPREQLRRLDVTGSGTRRREQLLEPRLQRVCDLGQHGQGRIRAARLQVAPGGTRNTRDLGHLLLCQAAPLAQAAHVVGQVAGGSLFHRVSILPFLWHA
jgi:hypothetical protein